MLGSTILRTMAAPLVVLPPILVWLVVGAVTWSMPLNELRLMMLEQQVSSLDHPEGSSLIASFTEVGVLDGNGNHCDFIAAEIRRASSSLDEVRAHYRRDPRRPDIYVATEPFREDNYLPTRFRAPRPDDALAAAPLEQSGVYVVYLYEGMGSPDGDPRCH